MTRKGRIFGGLLIVLLAGLLGLWPLRHAMRRLVGRLRPRASVADRVRQFGGEARSRWAPYLDAVGLSYPPQQMVWVGLKDERVLEVWGQGDAGSWVHIRTLPILGASGTLGPKLREGDRQVPEGIYQIESLNPNSRYHLSLRVNYPNAFDLRRAKEEGRANPGSDIMIHGSNASVGCLAMGDEAAEDLFVLAAAAGITKIRLILAPVDFRKRALPEPLPERPEWLDELYDQIREELANLPLPSPK